MLNFASRLIVAGVDVRLVDLNLDELSMADIIWAQTICISVLGTPYIPSAIRLVEELRTRGFTGKILVGGQGVERFNQAAFDRLFSQNAIQAHEQMDLQAIFGAELPTLQEVSMVPALKLLCEERRALYLSQEFPLYLSQGCRFSCNFCAAAKDRPERYRLKEAFEGELNYIISELIRIDVYRLEVYISNLDAFQNPVQLERMLEMIHDRCKRSGIEVHVRCLSTMAMFAFAARKDPELPARLKSYGLRIIAFGADGGDKRVWARMGKRHNSLKTLEEAVKSAQAAGYQVEILMVIGFRDDDALAMYRALRLSLYWAKRGCILRPYLGKPPIDHMEWEELKQYVESPDLIVNLDYAAFGSRSTHPNGRQRLMVNATYLAVMAALTPFGLNTTFPILPLEGSRVRRALAHTVNRFMPADR